MITEKRLLKLSGKYALLGLAISLFCWFVVFDLGICHAQTQTGYRVPARLDVGGGRMTGDMWCQYGTNGVRFIIGTQTVTQVGTVGVINGTNAVSLPSLDFTYNSGSISANFDGFNAVYVAGSQVGTSGALTGKLDAVDGVGTNNTFNNPTLAGVGTLTASFGANGLVISPAEYSSVNNATGELQAQIDTRLVKVGTPSTYLNFVTADGKTGTTSVSIAGGSNVSIISTLNPDGSLAVVVDTTGSATAKPDIKEGGTVTVSNTSDINFDNTDFDTVPNGLGADIALSTIRKGTVSASAGCVPLTDNRGSLTAFVKTNIVSTVLDTATTKTGASWSDISGLAVTITPSSASKQIMLIANVSSACSEVITLRLARNGVAIGVGQTSGSRIAVTSTEGYHQTSDTVHTVPMLFLDSPGTVTATNYTVQGYVRSGATLYINRSAADVDATFTLRPISSITAIEIN